MNRWIVEDPTAVCVVLILAGLALAAHWCVTRNRAPLFALAVIALLLATVLLAYKLVDTDSKRIQRVIDDMAAGVAARNVNRIFANISDSFHVGSIDRDQFRRRVEDVIRREDVQGIAVWDYEAKTISRERREASVIFAVKGHGQTATEFEFYRCRAVFHLDGDGGWRLSTFDLFPPQVDPGSPSAAPLPLPF